MAEATEVGCLICHRPKSDHLNSIHKFIGPGESIALIPRDDAPDDGAKSATGNAQGLKGSLLKGDPILRMLLIRKGLVTSEELTALTTEVEASGLAWFTSP